MKVPARPNWHHLAACHDVAVEVFFDGPPSTAKTYCQRCEVVVECASTALADPSLHGVWGGMTTKEREDRRRRKRAS